jgi:hypothetical protein
MTQELSWFYSGGIDEEKKTVRRFVNRVAG